MSLFSGNIPHLSQKLPRKNLPPCVQPSRLKWGPALQKTKMNKNVFLKSMLPTPGASISIVSELVDMEAMEAISQTSELTSHLHWPTGDKNIF